MSLDLLPVGESPALKGVGGYPAPVVSAIVRGYLKHGARVTAVTTSVGLHEPLVVSSGQLKVIVVPRTRARSAVRMFRTERESIVRTLMDDPPDVLHAQWTYEFAAAAQDTGIPALVTARDDALAIVKFRPTLYRILRAVLDEQVLRAAPCVSVTSEYMAERIGSRARGSVVVIPNFIDERLLESHTVARHEDRVVITVSNGFSRWKNIGAGLEAFASSRAAQSGWRCELVGQGLEPGGAAEQWAGRRGLLQGVRFRGPLTYDQTLDAIARASIMVHPSLEESFGMSVLEAMALGTPVIGGLRSGNIPALLSDGCGVLCDVSSPSSIARELDELASRPNSAHQIAARAKEHALSRYGTDCVVAQYLEVLSELPKGRRAVEVS